MPLDIIHDDIIYLTVEDCQKLGLTLDGDSGNSALEEELFGCISATSSSVEKATEMTPEAAAPTSLDPGALASGRHELALHTNAPSAAQHDFAPTGLPVLRSWPPSSHTHPTDVPASTLQYGTQPFQSASHARHQNPHVGPLHLSNAIPAVHYPRDQRRIAPLPAAYVPTPAPAAGMWRMPPPIGVSTGFHPPSMYPSAFGAHLHPRRIENATPFAVIPTAMPYHHYNASGSMANFPPPPGPYHANRGIMELSSHSIEVTGPRLKSSQYVGFGGTGVGAEAGPSTNSELPQNNERLSNGTGVVLNGCGPFIPEEYIPYIPPTSSSTSSSSAPPPTGTLKRARDHSPSIDTSSSVTFDAGVLPPAGASSAVHKAARSTAPRKKRAPKRAPGAGENDLQIEDPPIPLGRRSVADLVRTMGPEHEHRVYPCRVLRTAKGVAQSLCHDQALDGKPSEINAHLVNCHGFPRACERKRIGVTKLPEIDCVWGPISAAEAQCQKRVRLDKMAKHITDDHLRSEMQLCLFCEKKFSLKKGNTDYERHFEHCKEFKNPTSNFLGKASSVESGPSAKRRRVEEV
ncbi:hypothetical protein B0H11DRAFT_2239742 [Mycena galericulata]|nr:hypothetical protein B0H11DRAFT_2239742 [Mycena galericulata]